MGSGEPELDLFGEPIPPPPPEALRGGSSRWRWLTSPVSWFSIGKGRAAVAAHARNVLAGRHPLGGDLSTVPGALCGNCAFLTYHARSKTWWKCGRERVTHGPGTDLRAKWRACSAWKVAPPEASVPRRRPRG